MSASANTRDAAPTPKRRPEEENCVFCAIVRGEEEHRLVYRDDTVVVFHDRYPKAETHLLVIPVRHVRDIKTLRYEEDRHQILEYMLSVGKKCLAEESSKKKNGLNGQDAPSKDAAVTDGPDTEQPTAGSSSSPPQAQQENEYEHRFGFHVPPFTSVDHLHLHCLAPPFVKRNPLFSAFKGFHLKYTENAPWYMPADQLVRRFKEAIGDE
eukprot:Opistho-2@13155